MKGGIVQALDVMTSPVLTVTPNMDVRETAKRLLDNRISALPVVDDAGKLVGIVSEGDLMRRAESGTERRPSWWLSLLTEPDERTRSYVKSHSRRISDVMTTPVVTVEENTPLETIAETLEKNRIKRVPVVREGQLVGIVSRADLLHGLIAGRGASAPSADDRTIKAAVIDNLAAAGISRRLINIVVSGGNVNIWGVAETQEELDAIRVAAEQASGAKSVACNIDVLPATARAVLWPD
jgi:CBS domain-containing protein